LLLALLLSMIATFVISTVYVFFPLIVLLLKPMWGAQHIDGIFSVGNGVQLRTFLIIEPINFVITLLLLNRKQTA